MNFNREELEMLQDDSGGTFGSAYVKQLAADLLEARAMIREMRKACAMSLDTLDRFEIIGSSRIDILNAINASEEFADE
jgi:hypothetical protein